MAGVGAERGGDLGEPLRDLDLVHAEVDGDARGRGDVAEVGQQPVGGVHHGRGARDGGLRPGAVGGFGHAVGADDGDRGAESAPQHR